MDTRYFAPMPSPAAPLVFGPSGPLPAASASAPSASAPSAPPPDAFPARPAAFVDRDGVVNEGVPDPFSPSSSALESPLRVRDVRLLPGVASALRALADEGFLLVCVSNQPAAAKAKMSVAEVRAVHSRVLELLSFDGARFDASYLCPHHPSGVVAELSGPCACRKPAPGMLLAAAASLSIDLSASWMFGDTDTDIAAGAAAGCRTVLIDYPGSAHKRTGALRPSLRAASLPAAVSLVLSSSVPAPPSSDLPSPLDPDSPASAPSDPSSSPGSGPPLPSA
jgi:D-glycero-D-manno-heptose 1,7-bisphosphate phosphatase